MSSPTSHLACPQLALLNQAMATHPCTLGTANSCICRCLLVCRGQRGRRAHRNVAPPCSFLSLTRLHRHRGLLPRAHSCNFPALPLCRSAILPRYCHGTQARPHTGRATWSPHSVGRLGAPWAGIALRAGRPMGGSSAASQLQADLLPEVPRTQPLAAFFFPSTAPIPIALALGHFFSLLTTRLMTRTTFAIHTPTSSTPEPSRHAARRTLHPTPAEHHATVCFVSTVQYGRTAQQQTAVAVIVLVGATRLLELGPVPSVLHGLHM